VKLPLKLAIFVIILFALVVTAMLLWKPVKVRYYTSKYSKATIPQERLRIAEILCDMGEPGKKALYKVFREFCISEQVKIPAGTLTQENGTKIETKGFYIDKHEVTNEKWATFRLCAKDALNKVDYSFFDFEYDPDAPAFDYIDYLIKSGLEEQPYGNMVWKEVQVYMNWIQMRFPTISEHKYSLHKQLVDKKQERWVEWIEGSLHNGGIAIYQRETKMKQGTPVHVHTYEWGGKHPILYKGIEYSFRCVRDAE